MLYIGTSTCSHNTCYQIEYKYKNCKIIKIKSIYEAGLASIYKQN
jgi:hypothetical protein